MVGTEMKAVIVAPTTHLPTHPPNHPSVYLDHCLAEPGNQVAAWA